MLVVKTKKCCTYHPSMHTQNEPRITQCDLDHQGQGHQKQSSL